MTPPTCSCGGRSAGLGRPFRTWSHAPCSHTHLSITRDHVHAVAEPSQSGHGWCTRLSWASVSVKWRAGSSFAGVGSGLSAGPSSDGDRMPISIMRCEYSPVEV